MNSQYILPSVVLLAITSACPANLLVNGSFEDGPGGDAYLEAGSTEIAGWTIVSGSIDYVPTTSYWPASDGLGSIDLDGMHPGTIAQAFTTVPDRTYVVTFDMAGNYAGDPVIKQMRVVAAGQSADFTFDTTGLSRDNFNWESHLWSFTANSTSTTIEFRSLHGSGFYGAALDNVSVTPEPSAIALLAMGSLCVRSRKATRE